MHKPRVVVIGAGFTGLAAAYQLVQDGIDVTVLEREAVAGGLAAGFTVAGRPLERFYHHWFTSDRHVTDLIAALGAAENMLVRETRTGLYYANRIHRLSRPLDLLTFAPLPMMDRLRLGWLALRARHLRDWRALDAISAEDWLIGIAGRRVYEVVWAPLLRGKFGTLAAEVSAVWMWNKLKLRGGSRAGRGVESLVYYRGGFSALTQRIVEAIESRGGRVQTSAEVTGLRVADGRLVGVETAQGHLAADAAIATPALPIVADLMAPHVRADYLRQLRVVRYLGNLCVVLELDRSLSDTYWLNVNDPSFPFVGVIEHTNFEPASSYGQHHIVYLSRYLSPADPLYRLSDDATLAYCLPHLQRMFPDFSDSWVLGHHVWRARYAQPVMDVGYGRRIPPVITPIAGLYLATMAQIYPQDRGTNYAVREGRKVACQVRDDLGKPKSIRGDPRG